MPSFPTTLPLRRARLPLSLILSGLLLPALAATPVLAEGQSGGGFDAGELSTMSEVNVGVVRPQRSFADAAALSAGVGLRNRASGAIEFSGMPNNAEIVQTRLYWNIITNGRPPAGADTIVIQRLGPDGSNARTLTGRVVGTGASPCWGGTQNTVYRAIVPQNIFDGNGTYLISPPEGVPGRVDGASPWPQAGGSSPLPAYNGASLLSVFASPGARTLVYEEPLSGVMFSRRLDARLHMPPNARFPTRNDFLHMINSDGQTGNPAPVDMSDLALVQTRVNGMLVGGRSSAGHDSDWNGAQGGRVTQLWDNAIREISSALGPNRANANLRVIANGDCLVPVAAALVRIPF